VIWTTALGNIPLLRSTISYAALSERLDRYYHPYYAALALLLERRRRDLGHAVVLDAHSMPSSVPGDLILGTLGGSTCSPALKAAALDALSEPGSDGAELEIKLDEPYRGGEVVRRFGRPAEALHALQLEVSRDLYMDEHRLELWSHSPRTAHPRRPLLAATRNRVVCLMGALAGARPESQ
jgi:N-formylglutamate amidohydrolase